MSYIGNKPATSFETVQKQISTSNSGTTITLDRAVTSVQDILLTIDAVVQSYDNYSVSGTTLTVGGTLNNNRVEILYVGRTMQSVDPTDDSVLASNDGTLEVEIRFNLSTVIASFCTFAVVTASVLIFAADILSSVASTDCIVLPTYNISTLLLFNVPPTVSVVPLTE